MEEIILPEIKTIKETENEGTFVIEPLYPGYGQTLGNSLRRVLISSLEGAAVSQVKIEGVPHEFSTLEGVLEDVVEIILNLKSLRVRLFEGEEATLSLNEKGPKEVTASCFKCPASVEIKNPQLHIATLNKNGKLSLEAKVDKGRGYLPVEMKTEKPEIGVISLDSLYSPVLAVNFKVENTRVGRRTDFNKLTLEIKTDGTISPSFALKEAASILVKQFNVFREIETKEIKKKVKKEKKSGKRKKSS